MKALPRIGTFALVIAMAPVAWSAGPTTHRAASEARHQYQEDRAYCTSGQATEDRATCLKEAAAAYAEARHDNSTRAMGAGPAHSKQSMHKAKTEAKAKAKSDDK